MSLRVKPVGGNDSMVKRLSLWGGKPLTDGYTLVRLIGRGGFGEVWEAEAGDRRAALKFLQCADAFSTPRELRSIVMLKDLSHPNLVRISEVRSQPGYLAVSMELADCSLADVLESHRNCGRMLTTQEGCTYLSQAAAALDFLNSHQHRVNGRLVGIQHGDIKPSNILLFGDVVKLCDFGLASTLSAPVAVQFVPAGSPAYAAPEIFAGRLSDRSDQYSLAVAYCELRMGRPPFPKSPSRFSARLVRGEPDLTGLSSAEARVVGRALSNEPSSRWPTCGQFMSRLAEVDCPAIEKMVTSY